jgi:hypothetical protein
MDLNVYIYVHIYTLYFKNTDKDTCIITHEPRERPKMQSYVFVLSFWKSLACGVPIACARHVI